VGKYYKIKFLGDFMYEGTLLNTAKNDDVYDFMKSFEKIKTKLSSSNLVIDNFESVLTGKD